VKTPTPPANSGLRTTLIAVAMFVVLCGLILVTMGTRSVPFTPPETTSKQHIEAAKEWSYEAERSLHDGNYGEAEDSVVELRKHLDAAIAALES
jgi:hypothetical protein